MKSGTAHYQILEYRFGGLKFLVRSGVDGRLSDSSSSGQDAATVVEDLSLGMSALGNEDGGPRKSKR